MREKKRGRKREKGNEQRTLMETQRQGEREMGERVKGKKRKKKRVSEIEIEMESAREQKQTVWAHRLATLKGG